MKILVSVLAILCLHHCGGSLFYVYDWPKVPYSSLPDTNASLHVNSTYSHTFSRNSGLGDVLQTEIGLFQTWQFGLYHSLFNRLLLHPMRTRDPQLASAFIMPFDFGVHTLMSNKDGYRSTSTYNSPIIRDEIASYFNNQQLTNDSSAYSGIYAAGGSLRNGKPTIYWKNNGHDHYIILGPTIFSKLSKSFQRFMVKACRHCIILSIETTPTLTPFNKGFSQNYIYAVPYPSSFHYHEHIQKLPWLVQGNSGVNEKPTRDILSLFIGSTKTLAPISNKLRRILQIQCMHHNRVHLPNCVWESTIHSSAGVQMRTLIQTEVVNSTFRSLNIILRSVFCIHPIGDSYTRKAIFDSMLGGCIPVMFTRGSISQYHWFLSDEEVSNIMYNLIGI